MLAAIPWQSHSVPPSKTHHSNLCARTTNFRADAFMEQPDQFIAKPKCASLIKIANVTRSIPTFTHTCVCVCVCVCVCIGGNNCIHMKVVYSEQC